MGNRKPYTTLLPCVLTLLLRAASDAAPIGVSMGRTAFDLAIEAAGTNLAFDKAIASKAAQQASSQLQADESLDSSLLQSSVCVDGSHRCDPDTTVCITTTAGAINVTTCECLGGHDKIQNSSTECIRITTALMASVPISELRESAAARARSAWSIPTDGQIDNATIYYSSAADSNATAKDFVEKLYFDGVEADESSNPTRLVAEKVIAATSEHLNDFDDDYTATYATTVEHLADMLDAGSVVPV